MKLRPIVSPYCVPLLCHPIYIVSNEHSHLDSFPADVPTECDLLSVGLDRVPGDGKDDLSDEVVLGKAVEAEHDEMERHLFQLVPIISVEGEDLVEDRVPRVSDHPRLRLVLLLRQQLQLDVWIGQPGSRIHRWKIGRLDDAHGQSFSVSVVLQGEH